VSSEKINFASENFAGVQEDMLKALLSANGANVPSYGNDPITRAAVEQFKDSFGDNIEVYFTFNGTGANNFGLSCTLQRHHSIFCTHVAHLYVDESTATEAFTGCRIYPVHSINGKMVIDGLRRSIKRLGDPHHPQPGVVSLTQPTEYGTVYTKAELKAIKAICRENNMLLHIDGARFFNAAIYLNESLKDLCQETGIDMLTLGGTKAGMMFGEAVVFFNPVAGNAYKFNLKRSMQLASKNRFIATQFEYMLREGLWQKIARHTNGLARYFAEQITGIHSLQITHPVETNAVFVRMPLSLYHRLQETASFYLWNEEKSEARFMFSFNSTKEEVDQFIRHLSYSEPGVY
jgi:threonine aldolase